MVSSSRQISKQHFFHFLTFGLFLLLIGGLWYSTLALAEWSLAGNAGFLPVVGTAIICWAAILIGGVLLIHRKHPQTENVFLFLFLLLGIGMMFIMPIGRAPDEPEHLRRVYLIATGQWFPGVNGLLPENFFGYEPETITHAELRNALGITMSTQLIPSGSLEPTAVYPIVDYFPQALMMRLAMLVTNCKLSILYAARIGSLITSAALFYLAIRITPKGKNIILALALSPMTLQEAASASADGLTIAIVTLFVASIIRMTESPLSLSNSQIAALSVLSILVTLFKVFYLPLLLLLLTVHFTSARDRKRCLLPCFTAAAAALALWLVLQILPLHRSGDGIRTSGFAPALLTALQHPAGTAFIIGRTIMDNTLLWVQEMAGYHLGWFNLQTTSVLCFAYIAVAVWMIMQEQPLSASARTLRRIMAVLCAISVLAVILSLLGWWTPDGSPRIEGIQGRYFLPLFFPFCLAIKKNGYQTSSVSLTKSYLLLGLIILGSLFAILVQTL